MRHVYNHKKQLLFISSLIGLFILLSFIPSAHKTHSSELGFSEVSPTGKAGGQILPASCESGAGETGVAHWSGDTSGFCYPPILWVQNPSTGAWISNGGTAYTQANQAFNVSWQIPNYSPDNWTSCGLYSDGNIWYNPIPPVTYYPTPYATGNSVGNYGVPGTHTLQIVCQNIYFGWSYSTVTIITETPTACTSTPNACGQTNTGTKTSSTACTAVTPANPANYGTTCTARNSCGQSYPSIPGSCSPQTVCTLSVAGVCLQTSTQNVCQADTNPSQGTIGCNGQCSGLAPSNPENYGASCKSEANSCGMTANGLITCGGCSASKPSESLCSGGNLGDACTSGPNACGMTGTGKITVNGCDAVPPPNSLCAPSTGTSTSSTGGTTGQTGALDITITASPRVLRFGGSTDLNWIIGSAAKSCYIVDDSNTVIVSNPTGTGTQNVPNITKRTTFTLVCAKPTPDSRSITVSVGREIEQ